MAGNKRVSKRIIRSLVGRKKISRVMREHKEGTLKSSSGQRVTNRRQAIAIALSVARKEIHKKKKVRG